MLRQEDTFEWIAADKLLRDRQGNDDIPDKFKHMRNRLVHNTDQRFGGELWHQL